MAKFTTEQALEAIKGRFTNAEGKTSLKLSERSVKETLSSLISLAGEDMELDAFVDNIAYGVIDTANRNFIHDTSDFVKDWEKTHETPPAPPTPPVVPPTPPTPPVETKEERDAAIAAAVAKAMEPYNTQLQQQLAKENAEARDRQIATLKEGLKLSAAWSVDFDNATVIAKYELGDKATAQEIFDKAKEKFNATLSARNEVYTPQESSGDPTKTDFKSAIERRKAEKERRDASLGKKE